VREAVKFCVGGVRNVLVRDGRGDVGRRLRDCVRVWERKAFILKGEEEVSVC
jgi:hypothetical protein